MGARRLACAVAAVQAQVDVGAAAGQLAVRAAVREVVVRAAGAVVVQAQADVGAVAVPPAQQGAARLVVQGAARLVVLGAARLVVQVDVGAAAGRLAQQGAGWVVSARRGGRSDRLKSRLPSAQVQCLQDIAERGLHVAHFDTHEGVFVEVLKVDAVAFA